MTFKRVLHPRSIAVFGGREAEEVIRQCESMGYPGELWPVHPTKDEIRGRKVYRSVDDLPGSPDVAYVAVNRNLTIEVVEKLSNRGAGGAVCYATGYTEAGEEGAKLEKRLLEAAGDMPLLGPNCYGMLNYIDGAMLWPDQQGGAKVERGVAIITMSSNIAFNITMQRRGLPISYVLSLGNKLKFDLHDAIRIFAEQEKVSAIGLYVEGISDPAAFGEAIDFARDLGKPVVAIKSGRSDAAQKMVMSHTASLTGSDALIDALFKRIGVARVHSMEALIESLKVLHVFGPLAENKVGVMSTSGGDLSLFSDAVESRGLQMPALSDAGTLKVSKTVHERVVVANPLDYQMFDWNDQARLAAMNEAFISDGFDISVSLLDFPREDFCETDTWEVAERALVQACRSSGGRGCLMSTLSDNLPESVASRLITQGVVPLAGIDAGLAGLKAAADIGGAWKEEKQEPILRNSELRTADGSILLDEAESKKLLAGYGVQVPYSKVVTTVEAAASAAEEIGFPIALKTLGVAHKTDVGGVQINLRDEEQVVAAAEGMANLSDRFLVEKMVPNAVAELIVGVAFDEQFGPYLVIGAGGVLVELLEDSESLLLPVTRKKVLSTINSLKCARLFQGFRGRPKADVNAAVDVILAIGEFVKENQKSIVELDINPLMLLPEGQGAFAADALIRMK